MLKLLATTGTGVRWPAWLRIVGLVVAGVGVAGVAVVMAAHWMSANVEPSRQPATKAAATEGIVNLTPVKLAAAGLRVEAISKQTIQDSRRVPARIGYDQARRLELRVPVAGVVKRVLAGPGQAITRGDRLAMLTSVDVGMVRDSVIKAEADVELARKESDWATEISQNLDDLIKLLGRTPEVTYVEKHFEDKLLGDHREKVLSAYSKYLFAKRSAADTTAMNESGAISSRLVQERNSAREQTVAGFEATCEQSKFDAQQHRLRMLAALQHTERLLAVERQKLQLLLGPFAEILPTADDKALCELVLRAPLSGVVEERLVADGLQFTNSQTLFTVANTETLWVSAQVYERDWAALADGQVREVTVEVPAVPAKPVTARVKFTGVTISPETRSIPLVAELPNAEGHFKPGMFAWVSIPLSEPHHALVVPTEAVMRDQQATYVFVEERPGRYRKVDVKIGLETPQRIEILSGLHGGETVVNHGAFFLKSELLLALQSDGE